MFLYIAENKDATGPKIGEMLAMPKSKVDRLTDVKLVFVECFDGEMDFALKLNTSLGVFSFKAFLNIDLSEIHLRKHCYIFHQVANKRKCYCVYAEL